MKPETPLKSLQLMASQVDQLPLNLVSLARCLRYIDKFFNHRRSENYREKKLAPALGARVLILCGLCSLPKGGKIMKRAINIVIAGCLLGALAPSSFNTFTPGGLAVEASPALAFVTGTVRDERGTPLVGATVAVLERPGGKEIKSARTDTQGRFLTGVSPGAWWVRAMAEGFISKSTRLVLNRSAKTSYDFKLKSDNTLVQKRGDSENYRWISLSAPRHVLNLREETDEEVVDLSNDTAQRKGLLGTQSSLHGMAQFVAVTSSAPAGLPAPDFFGTNFA